MKRWSDRQEQTLRELWQEGVSSRRIAIQMGTSDSWIRKKAKLLNLGERQPGRRYKDPVTASDIARMKGPMPRKKQPDLPDWLRQLWRLDLAKL